MADNTALTIEEFNGIYPEFSGVPVVAVENELSLSNARLSYSAWGQYWRIAVGLLTAHYLYLRFSVNSGLQDNGLKSPTDGIATTTSKGASNTGLSEGSVVSALVSSENPLEADLARTSHGLKFLSLMYAVVPCGQAL